jgi:hypothetical protein
MRTPPRRLLKRPAPRPKTDTKLGMVLFDVKGLEGSTTLLIVPRVGTIEHVPNSYELGSCDQCGHATWVNSGFMATWRRRGLKVRIECLICTPV